MNRVESGTSDAICHEVIVTSVAKISTVLVADGCAPPAPASMTLKRDGSSALQASLANLSAQMAYMQQREKPDEWSRYNYNSPQEMRVECPTLAPGSSFGPARV